MSFNAVLDADGAVVVVSGGCCPTCGTPVQNHRVPGNAAEFDTLARRAATIAAALGGVPPGPEQTNVVVHYQPFARQWPPRLAVEAMVPRAMTTDPQLATGPKFLYQALMGEVAVSAVVPKVWGLPRTWARAYGLTPVTVVRWLELLVWAGWAEVRPAPHHGNGMLEVELLMRKRWSAMETAEQVAAAHVVLRPPKALPPAQPPLRKTELAQVGKQLARARKQAGLTQRELAESLGVTPGTVSEWETGATAITTATMVRVRRELGLEVRLVRVIDATAVPV